MFMFRVQQNSVTLIYFTTQTVYNICHFVRACRSMPYHLCVLHKQDRQKLNRASELVYGAFRLRVLPKQVCPEPALGSHTLFLN